MKNIQAIIVDGKEFRVGKPVIPNDPIIREIKDFGNGINEPRNSYHFVGYFGLDEEGNTLFETMTNSAIVLYV